MADKAVVNDADFNVLYDRVDALLSGISNDFKLERPSWDDYFMNIARTVSTRSNCIKRHVASVIVRDKRIVSTGYNGTPRGVKNCSEGGCPRCNNFADAGEKLDECLCSHGEENAIVQAAYHGVSLKGAVLYTTLSPCLTCAKMIINSGIAEVIYNGGYPLGENAAKLLREAGVMLREHKYEGSREHFHSV
ncbi:dCMP deaminase family protein [Candidatus Micrarchaeota archaeon]|nr:dCMP deaminase family protein [Candidatus Micrarchaeota archaeon]